MRETLQDILRALSGEQRSRQTEWRRLRGGMWLDHAIWKSGLTLAEFSDEFVHRGRSASNLVAKWKDGSTLPSRTSAVQLEKVLPGTLELFELPLFQLLDNRPLAIKPIEQVLARCGSEEKYGWQWRFPGDEAPTAVAVRGYSPVLAARGDLWGLTGIVALVRQAEAMGDSGSHLELSKDMFRMLPAILKLPWARPHADLLIECVEGIRRRMLLSTLMFDVDTTIIMRLADAGAFTPDQTCCSIDPSANSVEVEDPVLEARLVPGSLVRAQKQAKERRRSRLKSRSHGP